MSSSVKAVGRPHTAATTALLFMCAYFASFRSALAALSSEDFVSALKARDASILASHVEAENTEIDSPGLQRESITAALQKANQRPAEAKALFENAMKSFSFDAKLHRIEISFYQKGDRFCETDRYDFGPQTVSAGDSNTFRVLDATGPHRDQLTIFPASLARAHDLLTLQGIGIVTSQYLQKSLTVNSIKDGWRISIQVNKDQITTLDFDNLLDLQHVLSEKQKQPVFERWFWGYKQTGVYLASNFYLQLACRRLQMLRMTRRSQSTPDQRGLF